MNNAHRQLNCECLQITRKMSIGARGLHTVAREKQTLFTNSNSRHGRFRVSSAGRQGADVGSSGLLLLTVIDASDELKATKKVIVQQRVIRLSISLLV